MNDTRNTVPFLLHPALIASGATLLVAAFATDFVYWRTLLFQWNNFSIWLLAGGLVLAASAGIVLLLEATLRRVGHISWWRFIGFTVAALLSLLNAFVHSRDAYTAIVPEGFILSAIVTVLLVVLGRHGWSLGAPQPSSSPRSKASF